MAYNPGAQHRGATNEVQQMGCNKWGATNGVQHNEVQHNEVQHNEVQHNEVQHNEVQHNGMGSLVLGRQGNLPSAYTPTSGLTVPKIWDQPTADGDDSRVRNLLTLNQVPKWSSARGKTTDPELDLA